MPHSLDSAYTGSDSRDLWENGELVFRRGWRLSDNGQRRAVLMVLAADEHPSRASLDRLTREYDLKDQLDTAWAVRPLELVRDAGRTVLVLEDVNGEPLDRRLGAPLGMERFLGLAIAVTVTIGKLHQRGLVHKDIKPANILLDAETDDVRLTGFGIASRLERERTSHPPETIAGSLAYMAPEQTGRMNRSIDSRSDFYALGVTFYQMLTGALPFTANDPMDWVHCHLARQPVAPTERTEGIPGAVSAIVMKLLAKRAEDRYQTAQGLESDLRRCHTEWKAASRIEDFPLGKHDTRDGLFVPEKLYGRKRAVETLLASFERVVNGGTTELVLVSGYSGIGKSSVVNELLPVLVPSRGLFASGKFDQYKRDVPYSTLAQAFGDLVRQLLGKSEADLEPWREGLREALGRNAALIVDLVPDLKALIGSQPPVAEVPLQDAQRRFHLVFRQLIGVFARQEHPLVLFLDDLQWLDPATLDLLEDLSSRSELRHLLLIGAYRDNELGATHPLMRKVEKLRVSGRVQDIELAPLTTEDLVRLVADSLSIEAEQAAPLAQLVRAKTGGNPFFVIQFLRMLAEQGLVAFDHEQRRWAFDLAGIHAKQHTDNVVELLTGKLGGLEQSTQEALRKLACLGNVADVRTLSIVLGASEEGVQRALSEALQQQLVDRFDDSYRFVHDRVQEAAYTLIPEKSRPQAHLSIGRLLVLHTPADEREESIFELVNQLNRGHLLIDSRDEKDQLAELNLIAGKRARASTAHASALHYFVLGAALLSEDGWHRRPELVFALELQRAECEFLTGDPEAAEARLSTLSSRALHVVDRASVAGARIEVYTTLNQIDGALRVCVDYMSHLGIDWSPHPTEEEARREYERTWTLLGQREIEELVDLPLMSNPEAQATIEVLTKTLAPALFTDPNLLSLVLWRMVNLSLEFGHAEASCQAYAHIWMSAGPRFGNYGAGFRFGRLAVELVERRGLKRFEARTYLGCAVGVASWSAQLRTARDFLRRGFDAANTAGDLMYAAFSWHHVLANFLMCGDPLVDAQREAERGLEFVEQASFGLEIGVMRTHLAHIRSLRGLTATFGCLDDEHFDELEMERHLQSDWRLGFAEWRYWTRKSSARFLAGDHASAVEASRNVERLAGALPSSLETAEGHFYGALGHAGAYDPEDPLRCREHVEALARHQEQLRVWAAICPETLECRAALVDAEIARIEARALDAERHYEAAIQSARSNEFVQVEAIASELAARFYARRGFPTIERAYLREARSGYLRWGADGKVRQLESLHPFLRDRSAHAAVGTIAAPIEHLDFATVVKVSQAVSGEMVLEKLIDALMSLALQHAGAERGLLLLSRGNDLQQEAEATIGADGFMVRRQDAAPARLPESIVDHVMSSREVLLLEDASVHPTYSADPYVRERNARAILCLPLVNDARFIGVLYLENNLAPHVFTQDRVTLLKVVASQAAISLENSHLYRDLAGREKAARDSEGKFRDYAETASDWFWEIGTNYEFTVLTENAFGSDAARRMGTAFWDHALDLKTEPEKWQLVRATLDSRNPFRDFVYCSVDAKGAPLHVKASGKPVFDANGDFRGYRGTGSDVTAIIRAQEDLTAARAELAHAARVVTLGALTASIAHEVNQPLSGIITNASTCLRMLGADPPNLEAVRVAVQRALRDGNRASDIVQRLRGMFSRKERTPELVDLNEAARELLALTSSELQRRGVTLRTDFAEGLPAILGDRVQLQQVILNLVINGADAMQTIDDRPRNLLVATGTEGDGIRLSVCDAGCGIDPEFADKLFAAFHTTKSDGMGIGLSISRSIVESHDGRIWASNNEGPGATFAFSIPAARG